MYYITFRGNTRRVSAGVFWALAIPMLMLFAGMLFLVYAAGAGLVKAGGWLALIAAIVVFAKLTVTANGREKVYALIPNDTLRVLIGFPVMLAGCYFYFLR